MGIALQCPAADVTSGAKTSEQERKDGVLRPRPSEGREPRRCLRRGGWTQPGRSCRRGCGEAPCWGWQHGARRADDCRGRLLIGSGAPLVARPGAVNLPPGLVRSSHWRRARTAASLRSSASRMMMAASNRNIASTMTSCQIDDDDGRDQFHRVAPAMPVPVAPRSWPVGRGCWRAAC